MASERMEWAGAVRALGALLVVAGLTACGGGTPGEPEPQPQPQPAAPSLSAGALTLGQHPPGSADTLQGAAGAASHATEVRVFADAQLTAPVASASVAADGSFAAVGLGDNAHAALWVVARSAERTSAALQLANDVAAPEARLVGRPPPLTREPRAPFTFGCSEAGCTYACRLDAAAWAACTQELTLDGLAAGEHTLAVRATDAAGNTGTDVTARWTVDLALPSLTVSAHPAGTLATGEAHLAFTCTDDTGGCTTDCQLDGAEAQACTSPHAVVVAHGAHTLVLRAHDAAGNVVVRTFPWQVDLQGPEVTLTERPADATRETTARFAFTAEAGATFECRLGTLPFAPCTSPTDYAGLTERTFTFAVRATDALGNTGPTRVATWTVDRSPPLLLLSGLPLPLTRSTEESIGVYCTDEACTLECRVDGAPRAACPMPLTLRGLGDGPHTLDLWATDALGNEAQRSHGWTVDATGPVTTLTGLPPARSSDPTPTVSFSCPEEGCTFECGMDALGEAACTSPHTYPALPHGPHRLTVRAFDALGNPGPLVSHVFQVDTQAPTVTMPTRPGAFTGPRADFGFACSDGDGACTYACRLDAGAFEACPAVHAVTGLTEGPHTLTVAAFDDAGNRSAELGHTWTVDTQAPVVTLDSGPGATQTSLSATFAFRCSESGATQCRLDGADFTDCTSPVTYTGLSRSSHTFGARCTDAAGNVSAEATHAWSIAKAWAQASAAAHGTCAVATDGTLWCWGRNDTAQAGQGATGARTSPGRVGTASHWRQVAAADQHTCAVTTDGALWCWGSNARGRTGVGAATGTTYAPARVGADTDWERVVAGTWATCALKTDGTLWCWGLASYTGTGATSDVLAPAQVGARTDWSSLTAGEGQVCAVASGEAWCWGSNWSGELGNGTTTSSSTPWRVGNATDWVALEAGGTTTCGLRAGGALSCWGSNAAGQFGNGTTAGALAPVAALPGLQVEAFEVGVGTVCAVAQGALHCAGSNGSSRIDAEAVASYATARRVGDATDWSRPVLGAQHTCALATDGRLACWGGNISAQLGNGVAAGSHRLVQAALPVASATMATGDSHACAIATDGTLRCWGSNASGQLGTGDTLARQVPVQVGADADWVRVAAGTSHTCGIRAPGRLYCWGDNGAWQLGLGDAVARRTPVQVGTDSDWTHVDLGLQHTCGLRAGMLFCWGRGSEGQLGHGGTASQWRPVRVGVEADWAALALGGYHGCAVKQAGSLWCFGRNEDGQLGDGTTTQRLAPTRVGLDTDWAQVGAGFEFTCGIRTSGALACWGDNTQGQAASYPGSLGGIRYFSSPRTVVSSGYARMDGAVHYGCATRTDGALMCWGYASEGQLGTTGEGWEPYPRQVGSHTDWVVPATGQFFRCGVRAGGAGTWCVGNNTDGRLGEGTAWVTAPVTVAAY